MCESGLRTIKYCVNKKPPKGGFFVPGICPQLLPDYFYSVLTHSHSRKNRIFLMLS